MGGILAQNKNTNVKSDRTSRQNRGYTVSETDKYMGV